MYAMVELQSGQSTRVSLESIRQGTGGLAAHRQSMLDRVPNPGDWEEFSFDHHTPLEMTDLAYLTAKTGHEFAILRGKRSDILFHGTVGRCTFPEELVKRLKEKRLSIYGHSHPGEEVPAPSTQDRITLKLIGQTESQIISGRTGRIITFTANPFEM